jgi:hypothetical protein
VVPIAKGTKGKKHQPCQKIIANITYLFTQNVQQRKAQIRLIGISNEQKTRPLAMFYDSLDLAPGEVTADRYEPADEAAPITQVSAAELAAWEANPLF